MNFCQPTRAARPNPHDIPGEQQPFIILGPDSPLSYRRAARLLAEDFANSTHFSPAPYEAQEAESYGGTYLRDRVLLFTKPIETNRIRCFGAVGFRWKGFDDLPDPGWFMTWAWFHPTEQRQGHLTKAWPHIVRLFPNLLPLPPITDAMVAFLKKVRFDHPLLPRLLAAQAPPAGNDL